MKNSFNYQKLTLGTAGAAFNDWAKNVSLSREFPERCRGDGITICAGGTLLFANAWILIRMLRFLGCNLPIQLWHLGSHEFNGEMERLVGEYNVSCIDASDYWNESVTLTGWPLKPLAILCSPFRRVISLDADNVSIRDPTYLLDSKELADTGAIFWPDRGVTERTARIWDIVGIEYRDEPEFESGQIVVDKERCWKALQLTMWLNVHADFFYEFIWGDKDTFRFAWHKAQMPFSMPETPLQELTLAGQRLGVMCQHDFSGERVFQHRSHPKWSFFGNNPRIPGFLFEPRCLTYLNELREKWNGQIVQNEFPLSPEIQEILIDTGIWILEGDQVTREDRRRELIFLENGKLAGDVDEDVTFWAWKKEGEALILTLLSHSFEYVARLELDGDDWLGDWVGRSLVNTDIITNPSNCLSLRILENRFPGARESPTSKTSTQSPREQSKYNVYTSAAGIGDAVTAILASVGIANLGFQCVFHTAHAEWFERVRHDGLQVSSSEAPDCAVDLNVDYTAQLRYAKDKAFWYGSVVSGTVEPKIPSTIMTTPSPDCHLGLDDYIVLAPFSAATERDWPPAHWARLGEMLGDYGYEVIAIGSKDQESRMEKVFGKTSVYWVVGREPDWVISVLLSAKAFVGNDSGMTQIAALHGVPTVGIHAHLPPDFLWRHLSVESVSPTTNCVFCRWTRPNGYRPHCDIGCSAISTISPEKVLNGIKVLLGNLGSVV